MKALHMYAVAILIGLILWAAFDMPFGWPYVVGSCACAVLHGLDRIADAIRESRKEV